VLASLVTSTKPGSGNPSGSTTPAPAVSPADPSTSDIATYAQSFIGVPYVWAGSSTSGMDCSGFVSYVYANYYNMYLPHQSAKIEALGTPVSESEMQPGDVICYSYGGSVCDHVALYIGGGLIVHASSRNGKVVLAYFSMSSVTSIRRFI
jgi:cell wall-associated NlpC family hydrolase